MQLTTTEAHIQQTNGSLNSEHQSSNPAVDEVDISSTTANNPPPPPPPPVPPVHSGVLPMDEKALSGLQARMERLKSGSIDPPPI